MTARVMADLSREHQAMVLARLAEIEQELGRASS